jgi:hypothetical protein
MNQFAAKRYAQELSIRYVSGPRNHERHCRNAVAFAFTELSVSLEATLIVEAHGGRLRTENNPSGGATFNVALPVSPVVQTFDVS